MEKVIVLAGKEYPVKPFSLGQLKKLLPAFNRVGATFSVGRIDEQAINDLVIIVAAALGISVEEAELIPATAPELVAAIDIIADVSGLKQPPENSPAGEALRVLASIGTSFTPGS